MRDRLPLPLVLITLGLIIAFSGTALAVTDTVTVNATIEGTVAITVSTAIGGDSASELTNTSAVDFKPGESGNTQDSDDVLNDYITVENSGDLYVDVAAYSDAYFFTGGSIATDANQYINATNGEANSCKTLQATDYTTELSTSSSDKTNISLGLDWDSSSDLLYIHMKLTVPDDASATTYSNTVTIVAAEDTTSINDAY
jgi:hypothetical protein